MFVLGLDPGLSRCGYAVLGPDARTPRARALGVVRTAPEAPLPWRLAELQAEVVALIEEFKPEVMAVERVLFQVNVRTAMSVGQASGVAMAAAAARGCEVVQYSPNQVKEAVAGHGGAGKEQVQQMVQTLLRLPTRPHPPDAADAAALALCHLAMGPVHAAQQESARRSGRPPGTARTAVEAGKAGAR
jgi:crossover junction endodeoxyribonuclease RuvC